MAVRTWAVVLMILAGCADDKSFALVSVLTTQGELSDVAQLQVHVENGPHRDSLWYPKVPTSLRLDATKAVTFSLSFQVSHQGQLMIGVTPVSAAGATLGYGESVAAIAMGHTINLTVRVVPGAKPPARPIDGGAGDLQASRDGGIGPLPSDAGAQTEGRMPCEPAAPAMCGPASTCFVACRSDGTAGGLCTASGVRKAAQTCERNEDCEPQTQCFEFGCGTPKIKTCLRFCTGDGDCAAGRCSTTVPCMQQQTDFRVCSVGCDPTGEATIGCAPGLNCFLFEGELPDCDCRGTARVGGDGVTCADSADCRPGFLCVNMAGAKTCRALCRLAAPSCSTGTTCTRLFDPDYKTYGGCLP